MTPGRIRLLRGAACVLACAALLARADARVPRAQDPRASATIEATLASRFGITELEMRALAEGREIARTIPTSAPDGVATLGAIAIDARPSLYLEWAAAFADFDRGSSVQALHRLSDPPVSDDFAALFLSREELRDLKRCRIGACTLQIDASSIRQIASVNWNAAGANEQANAIVRRFMLDAALAYREAGTLGLPHYHDSREATDVQSNAASLLAEEHAAGRMPPALAAYLHAYPSAPLPAEASGYLYWMTHAFGLKPTTRLNHTVVYRQASAQALGVIATRQIAATHYFHGALDMRYVVGAGDRFVLVMVARTRSDGLTGLSGAFMRGTIRRRVVDALRAYLRFTKETVEKRQRAGGLR